MAVFGEPKDWVVGICAGFLVSFLFALFLSRWKPRLRISTRIVVDSDNIPTISVQNLSYLFASVENKAEAHYVRVDPTNTEHVLKIDLLKADPLIIESNKSGAFIHRDEFIFHFKDRRKDDIVKNLTNGIYGKIRFRIYSKDSFSNFGAVHEMYFNKGSGAIVDAEGSAIA